MLRLFQKGILTSHLVSKQFSDQAERTKPLRTVKYFETKLEHILDILSKYFQIRLKKFPIFSDHTEKHFQKFSDKSEEYFQIFADKAEEYFQIFSDKAEEYFQIFSDKAEEVQNVRE